MSNLHHISVATPNGHQLDARFDDSGHVTEAKVTDNDSGRILPCNVETKIALENYWLAKNIAERAGLDVIQQRDALVAMAKRVCPQAVKEDA